MQHTMTKPVTATVTGIMALAVNDLTYLLPRLHLVAPVAIFFYRKSGFVVMAGAAGLRRFHIGHRSSFILCRRQV